MPFVPQLHTCHDELAIQVWCLYLHLNYLSNRLIKIDYTFDKKCKFKKRHNSKNIAFGIIPIVYSNCPLS